MTNYYKRNHTLIYGTTGSGKTTIIKQIVRKCQNQYYFYIGAKANSFTIIPKSYRLNVSTSNFQEKAMPVIQSLFKTQQLKKELGHHLLPITIILDDVAGVSELRQNEFQHILTTCREFKINFIVAIQVISQFRPDEIQNFQDYIFCKLSKFVYRRFREFVDIDYEEVKKKINEHPYNFLYIDSTKSDQYIITRIPQNGKNNN